MLMQTIGVTALAIRRDCRSPSAQSRAQGDRQWHGNANSSTQRLAGRKYTENLHGLEPHTHMELGGTNRIEKAPITYHTCNPPANDTKTLTDLRICAMRLPPPVRLIGDALQ